MFSGKVFIWWIFCFCVLSSCAPSTVELLVNPNNPIDFGGNGFGNVTFDVIYNITEINTFAGIIINTGSTVVADCRLGILQPLTPTGMALSAIDLSPNGCGSLVWSASKSVIQVSSGWLKFGVTFSNVTFSSISVGWTAGLLDLLGNVHVSSSTLNITVGDLRKRTDVTISWTAGVSKMVFECSIGEVQPALNLVLTVPGVTPVKTVQTPGTAQVQIPHTSTLDGNNFSCAVEVVYPVPKSLTEYFRIEYAPVFQSDSVSVLCLDDPCQVTLNCSSRGIRAYPAATLTWPELNSTDGAIVVNGPGEYTCQATNSLGNDTVVFKVVEVCDGKVCQHNRILHLKTCKCSCKHWYSYGDECQQDIRPIVAVVVVLGVYIVYIVVNVVAAFTCFLEAGDRFRGLGVGGKVCYVAGGIVVMDWIYHSHGCCCQRPSTNDPQIGLKGTADGRMKPEVMARGGGGAATYDDVDLRSGPNADPRHTSEEVPSSNDLYTEVVRKVDRRAPGPGNRRGQGEEARMVENTIYGSN